MRYWSRLDPVYEHVNGDSGASVLRFASPGRKKTVHLSVMG